MLSQSGFSLLFRNKLNFARVRENQEKWRKGSRRACAKVKTTRFIFTSGRDTGRKHFSFLFFFFSARCQRSRVSLRSFEVRGRNRRGKRREDKSSKRQKGKQKASRRDSGRKFKVLLLVLFLDKRCFAESRVCLLFHTGLQKVTYCRDTKGSRRQRERDASLSFVLVEITSCIVANAIFEYGRETVFDLRERTCAASFSN